MGTEAIRVYIKADSQSIANALIERLLGIELYDPRSTDPNEEQKPSVYPADVFECDIDYTPEAMALVLEEHAKDRIFAIERPENAKTP